MLEKAQSYILYGNTFCGLEITSQKGKGYFYATVLKKQKDQLNIKDSHSTTSLEEMSEKLPKKTSVFLVINNQNVLTKQVKSDNKDPLKLLNKAFPNINVPDFFYEILIQDSMHFVSICRKEYVDGLLKSCNNVGLSIVNLSLGNLVLSSALDFMDTGTILTSNAEIFIQEKHIDIISTKVNEESHLFNLNGLEVSSHKLLSLVGALNIVIDRYAPYTNFGSDKNNLLAQFKQARFFNHFIKGGLVFLFAVLLINFLVFNFYFNKVQSLEMVSQINEDSKLKLVELNEKVDQSQKMVEDVFKNNSSRASYYINVLVQSLPNTMLLNEINYQPLLKRIRLDKPIESDNDILLIYGNTGNSDDFSEWLMDLENMAWIKRFEVLDYTDVSNSTARFALKIEILHD